MPLASELVPLATCLERKATRAPILSWCVAGLLCLGLAAGCSKRVTKPVADTSPPAPVASLAVTTTTTSSIELQWMAPGDDGTVGTATSYDLRYSTSPISEGTFHTATEVSGEPVPVSAGTAQSMIVTGLLAGSTYHFAIQASDEVPNVSALSNVATGTTLEQAALDAIPPGPVTNLTATVPTTSSITLNWTAPGDDGALGTATSYDLRFSTSPITESTFDNATEVSGEPTPASAGTAQSMIVTGLLAGTTYHFAIRASDEIPNVSPLSNVASEATVGEDDVVFGPPMMFETGQQPVTVTVTDFNGDGKPDVAAPNYFGSTVSVLLGTGDGGLAPRTDYAVTTNPFATAAGDFNQDGSVDLVVLDFYSVGSSVLLGNGDGTLGPRAALDASGDFVASGDLDHDGKVDLVTAAFSRGVSVLRGNGDGTFTRLDDYAVAHHPLGVAIGDLNLDGIPDIVSANGGDNDVSVLLGQGNGSFDPKVDYATANGTRSVAIADLNGDGKPDLATANSSNSISVLLGTGDGTFGSHTDFAMGDSPRSVAIGDFNADGRQDVVTADYFSDAVSVRHGNGDGTFGPRRALGMGPWTNSVAIADLNGDGKPDLVVANYGWHSVSVRLNIGP